MAIKTTKRPVKIQRVVKRAAEKVVGGKQASHFKLPTNKTYFEGVGRRKVAVARVRIYEGQGDFVVNDQLVGDYFSGVISATSLFNHPFDVTSTKGKFAVTAKVRGSGIKAQIAALAHGISRALVKFNPENKTFLKQAGLLTRDDRMKETRKIGMGGKARRQRQSPKR